MSKNEVIGVCIFAVISLMIISTVIRNYKEDPKTDVQLLQEAWSKKLITDKSYYYTKKELHKVINKERNN